MKIFNMNKNSQNFGKKDMNNYYNKFQNKEIMNHCNHNYEFSENSIRPCSAKIRPESGKRINRS